MPRVRCNMRTFENSCNPFLVLDPAMLMLDANHVKVLLRIAWKYVIRNTEMGRKVTHVLIHLAEATWTWQCQVCNHFARQAAHEVQPYANAGRQPMGAAVITSCFSCGCYFFAFATTPD